MVDTGKPAELPFAVKTAEPQADTNGHLASLAAGGDWSIQIGVYSTENDAMARLLEMRKKLPDILDGKTTQALAVEKGGKVIYRARFTGFDQDAAKAACQRVSKKKSGCFIQGPT